MKVLFKYNNHGVTRGPTLLQGRPFFISFVEGLIFLFFIFSVNLSLAQEVILDEKTKAICNEVMLNIYQDILTAKDKYPELSQFDEKVMYENEKGIYAIVYQYQPSGTSRPNHDTFEFGVTITTKNNTIFQDQRGYAFNLDFPFLGLKFAGYFKKGLKPKYDIFAPINKYGQLLADHQQNYLPLQLRLVTNKTEYKVKEPIHFEVELTNVSKKHMWVKNINEETISCLYNKRYWGTQARSMQSATTIILKSGESLKRGFAGEGFVEPQNVEIYCSYSMSLKGVKPAGVLHLWVTR